MRRRDTHRPAIHVAGVLVLVALAFVGAAAQAGAAGAKCQTLKASTIPLAKLEASYRTLTQLGPKTPLVGSGPRRYGVCGNTHYAFDLLTVANGVRLTYRQQVAQQDHSPVWRQKSGGPWVDAGLDSLCNLAPHALINLWHVGASCH